MIICEYGCGQEAKYQFKNGKWCCCSHFLKCPFQSTKFKGTNNPFYGKKHTKETKKKCSESNKGKETWNKGIPRTAEERSNISHGTKKGMLNSKIKNTNN